jgi:DNA-binding CsgD family transcriptional regulator/GAF domain-containing protein
MISERGVLRVVESIYAASEDPQLWNSVLTQLNQLFRTTHSALFLQDGRTKAATMAAYIWSPDSIARYAAHYARLNPWLYAPGADVHLGSSHTSEMLVSDRDLMRTEFYADFLAPDNIHHMIGACVYEDHDILGNITLLRPKRAKSFDDEEIGALRLLMPHLTRALQLHHRLHSVGNVSHALKDALNRLPTAVFMLDATGRLSSTNTAGERLLRSEIGLRLQDKTIVLSTDKDTAHLRRLIADAARAHASLASRGGGAMRCERRSPLRPLEILVCPAPKPEDILRTPVHAAVLVFVNDTNCGIEGSSWKTLYGFTDAECVVAERIAAGEGLRATASELGVSVNTVKSHVKSLFAKTDTHRQAELVRVLAAGIASVRR